MLALNTIVNHHAWVLYPIYPNINLQMEYGWKTPTTSMEKNIVKPCRTYPLSCRYPIIIVVGLTSDLPSSKLT